MSTLETVKLYLFPRLQDFMTFWNIYFEHGADIRARNDYALYWSVMYGHWHIFKFLLKMGPILIRIAKMVIMYATLMTK